MPRRRTRSGAPVSFFSFQDIILTTAGILILTTLLIVLTSVAEPSAAQAPQAATAESLAALAQVKADLLSLAQQIESQRRRAQAVGQLTSSSLPRALAELNRQASQLRERLEELSGTHRQAETTLAKAAQEADAAEAEAAQAREATRAADRALAELATSPRRFLVGEETQKPLIVEVDAAQVRVGELAERGQVRLLHTWPTRHAGEELVEFARTRSTREEYFVFFVLPGGADRYESLLETCESQGFAVGWEACPSDDPVFRRP